MSRDSYVRNNIVYNLEGGVLHVGVDEGENKYYAVIAQCGHVGRGYFIPICFGIHAKNMESAIELAKSTPRVKKDAKYCILGAAEISHPEYLLIEWANDHDPYLRTVFMDETYDEIKNRVIMTEGLVQDIIDENKAGSRGERKASKVPSVSKIKTAEQYDEDQILQRYFAPVVYGNQYVFVRRINMKELLEAYYHELAVKYGILKKKSSPLSFYYQIFGKDNALGISYDEQSGCLIYTSLNGNLVYVPLSKTSKEYIEQKFEDERLLIEETAAVEEVEYVPTRSAIDKFNRRLEKSKKMQKTEENQPGSEEV